MILPDITEEAPLPCVQERALEGTLRLRNWLAWSSHTHPPTHTHTLTSVLPGRCGHHLVCNLEGAEPTWGKLGSQEFASIQDPTTARLPAPWEQAVPGRVLQRAQDPDPGDPGTQGCRLSLCGPVRGTNPNSPHFSSPVKGDTNSYLKTFQNKTKDC